MCPTTRSSRASSDTRVRRANAWVAAALTLFFFAHEGLGAMTGYGAAPSRWAMLIWAAACLSGLHVVFSILTTIRMATDDERPPSARKLRHQVLKWVTGIVLVLFVILHVIYPFGASGIGGAFAVIVAVALAAHVCVGAKSLAKDIGASAKLKRPLQVIAAGWTTVAVIALILG